ncbi:hypothetical protein WV31_10245 [Magnetospirillum sp. ME-1]|uniref:hypothetical protein n=1 Tax=Magnetospirillum sp. ME-1 TaxID=1639348 RepID=UPI000A17B0D5|nr:hypothetical protein [Magnetospirillum sp. ME-1]ARJ66006.1 hypothetical protein WV31_10245 [Magnetospirillum sp. ME-1]
MPQRIRVMEIGESFVIEGPSWGGATHKAHRAKAIFADLIRFALGGGDRAEVQVDPSAVDIVEGGLRLAALDGGLVAAGTDKAVFLCPDADAVARLSGVFLSCVQIGG